jgi:hypothetical protein
MHSYELNKLEKNLLKFDSEIICSKEKEGDLSGKCAPVRIHTKSLFYLEFVHPLCSPTHLPSLLLSM